LKIKIIYSDELIGEFMLDEESLSPTTHFKLISFGSFMAIKPRIINKCNHKIKSDSSSVLTF